MLRMSCNSACEFTKRTHITPVLLHVEFLGVFRPFEECQTTTYNASKTEKVGGGLPGGHMDRPN